jgi:hypothetical protein
MSIVGFIVSVAMHFIASSLPVAADQLKIGITT